MTAVSLMQCLFVRLLAIQVAICIWSLLFLIWPPPNVIECLNIYWQYSTVHISTTYKLSFFICIFSRLSHIDLKWALYSLWGSHISSADILHYTYWDIVFAKYPGSDLRWHKLGRLFELCTNRRNPHGTCTSDLLLWPFLRYVYKLGCHTCTHTHRLDCIGNTQKSWTYINESTECRYFLSNVRSSSWILPTDDRDVVDL